MPVTRKELEGFHHFASERVGNGGAESLEDLVSQWRASHDYHETVAEVRGCMADMEAGIGRPLEEVDAEIRAKHGFAPRGDK
jgi:hypothetical protein